MGLIIFASPATYATWLIALLPTCAFRATSGSSVWAAQMPPILTAKSCKLCVSLGQTDELLRSKNWAVSATETFRSSKRSMMNFRGSTRSSPSAPPARKICRLLEHLADSKIRASKHSKRNSLMWANSAINCRHAKIKIISHIKEEFNVWEEWSQTDHNWPSYSWEAMLRANS